MTTFLITIMGLAAFQVITNMLVLCIVDMPAKAELQAWVCACRMLTGVIWLVWAGILLFGGQ